MIFNNMGLFDKPSAPKPSSPPPAALNKKVLVVEDEKLLGDALELKFTHAGFVVLRAENGQVGLEITIKEHPDIILLDLMMPVMDGKTMLRMLRDIPEFKTLPVLVLSNAGDIDNIRETQMYYGATDFLIKSNVTTDEIIAKVNKILI